MEAVEIEGKAIVTKDDFSKLLHFFKKDEKDAIIQHNYYFETDDFTLKRHELALRIRAREETYTLTLKQPADDGILETNQILTKKEFERAIFNQKLPEGVITAKLRDLNVPLETIQCAGKMTTRRIEFSYEQGTICLDQSEYFDYVDYEIEFEGTSRAHVEKTLRDLFSKLKITPLDADNKISRFFKRKMKR